MYSHNNEYPVETLHRIRLSSGLTRTAEFTEEELADAGWRIVPNKPEADSSKVVDWNQSLGEWTIRDKYEYEIASEKSASWRPLLSQRDKLLQESDITQLYDSFSEMPNGDIMKKLWAIYRKELRDITDNFSTPEDVVWPTKPTQYQAHDLTREELQKALDFYSKNPITSL